MEGKMADASDGEKFVGRELQPQRGQVKAFVLVPRRDNDQGHFKSPFEPRLSPE